jgi:hypothetical protein
MQNMVPTPTHDPRFMLRTALRGFEGARQRFVSEAAPGAAPEDVFIPLSEALWWAVTADDGFEDLARNGEGSHPNVGAYRSAKSKDPHGRVLSGLRYARDRCGHQRAPVAVEQDLTLPFTLPVTLGKFFRWRQSDQLPTADRKFRSNELQPDFDRLLAGRLASEFLESAAKWFALEHASAGL